MGYADAVTRERDWFLEDQSANGIRPLLKVGANDGPFAIVDAYPRTSGRKQNELYLWRHQSEEVRISTGRKRFEHQLVATILWYQANAAEGAHVDQAALDAAVERVLERIRALPRDKTHGGRFQDVGEPETGGTTAGYDDPLPAIAGITAPGMVGTQYRVDIHYQADDEFTA